jgi:hypothetical protein
MAIVQRSLLIEEETWKAAKLAAATEGISVSEFCSRAIDSGLNPWRPPTELAVLLESFVPINEKRKRSGMAPFGDLAATHVGTYSPAGIDIVAVDGLDAEPFVGKAFAIDLDDPWGELVVRESKPVLIKSSQDALNAIAEIKRRKG